MRPTYENQMSDETKRAAVTLYNTAGYTLRAIANAVSTMEGRYISHVAIFRWARGQGLSR